MNFFKMVNCGKFAVECVSNNIISQECLLHRNSEVFIEKNQIVFEVGKF